MSRPDRRLARAAASLGSLVLAVLLPKCPVCVAAWLSALGVGASLGATLAPVLRPLGFTLAALALAVFLAGEWRRRRARRIARRATAGSPGRAGAG
jgi:hypothetical protein